MRSWDGGISVEVVELTWASGLAAGARRRAEAMTARGRGRARRPTGRVRVNGELWRRPCAAGADAGATVIIKRLEALTLIVDPALVPTLIRSGRRKKLDLNASSRVECRPGTLSAWNCAPDHRLLSALGDPRVPIQSLNAIENALILLDTKPAEAIELAALERVRDDLAILLRAAAVAA
jgi:hypothetical protein